MTHTTEKREQAIAERLKAGVSFDQIASELSIPAEQVESVCFSLCHANPKEFKYSTYLTKEWLEAKAKDHSIFAIANITQLNYKQVVYRLGKYGLSTRKSNENILPTKEDLYRLYVTERKTDRNIAEQYGVPIRTIKNLRYKYTILRTSRKPLEEIITLEYLHRLYVELDISVSQICKLFETSRATLDPLMDSLLLSGEPLAREIEHHKLSRKSYYLFERLLSTVPHSELAEDLKTKGLYEIAAERKLLSGESNQLIPFTKEWLLVEMQTKSPTKIALENGKMYSYVSKLIDDYGIDRSKRKDEINPHILRRLFLELYWSDSEIAAQFGISDNSVREQRKSEGILAKHRLPIEERLPVHLFKKLYLHEGLSLYQIGSAFRISHANVRTLKKKYIESGHSELDGVRVAGVSEERFAFLQNQIALGVYEA